MTLFVWILRYSKKIHPLFLKSLSLFKFLSTF